MKFDRMIGILTILLQKDRVTAPYLSDRFEVSRRTIGRDIDCLCRAGIPIVTYQGGGGGISIAEGYKLDKNILTEREAAHIVAALRGIGSVLKETEVEQTIEKLSFKKGTVPSLKESIIIDLSSYYQESLTKKIELIKQAIQIQQLVVFDYYYKKGEVERSVEPHFVAYQWSDWYMFGYCVEREDWRMFKLSRLWNLKISPRSYFPRTIPEEKKDLNAHLKDDKRISILFDSSVKYKLVDSYGPDCFSETADGRLLVELTYTNTDFMLSWILGFGDKAKVMEPLGMAEEIKRIALGIYNQYQ